MSFNKEPGRDRTAREASVLEEPVRVLRIAVCDDEAPQLEAFRLLFDQVKASAALEVRYYAAAGALLEELRGGAAPDVIFCDIQMPELDGIRFGKMIHALSRSIFLVLFTACPEYAIRGYETRAFRYLLKPVTAPDVEQVLRTILREMSRCKKLLVRTAEGEYVRALPEITYLSAEEKYTLLHTADDHYLDRRSLNDYERLLEPYGFCRIHRKYLVNLAQHRSVKRGEVLLLDGTRLPISRRREAVYHQRLLQLLGEDLL